MTYSKTGLAAALLFGLATPALAQDAARMSFFVTSVGVGRGADLGGLAGADAHCQALATAVGAGARTWRAYLSTQGAGAVHARDRIGTGPWQNAAGQVIGRSVADLHDSNASGLTKATATTERGAVVNGRGDTPNTHDVLTGSGPDGRGVAGAQDSSCSNWTSSDQGSAMVGHSDRIGLRDDAASISWNASHPSRGCSQANLVSTGGAGLFYCFAAN